MSLKGPSSHPWGQDLTMLRSQISFPKLVVSIIAMVAIYPLWGHILDACNNKTLDGNIKRFRAPPTIYQLMLMEKGKQALDSTSILKLSSEKNKRTLFQEYCIFSRNFCAGVNSTCCVCDSERHNCVTYKPPLASRGCPSCAGLHSAL